MQRRTTKSGKRRKRGKPVNGEALQALLRERKISLTKLKQIWTRSPTSLRKALSSGVDGPIAYMDSLTVLSDLTRIIGVPVPLLDVGSEGRLNASAAAEKARRQNAVECVSKFYSHIAAKRFGEAWAALSDAYKAANHVTELASFESGYTSFRGIKNLTVAAIQAEGAATWQCLVYYDDEVVIPRVEELEDLFAIELGELDNIKNLLGRFRTKLHQIAKSASVSRLKLIHLLQADAAIYAQHQLQASQEQFAAAFGHRTAIRTLSKCFRVSAVEQNQQWFINRITPIRFAQSIR